VADALVDRHTDGEGDTSQHHFSGLVLVLVDGVGALLNQLVTKLANISNLGARNALQWYQSEYNTHVTSLVPLLRNCSP
jgi:hypothetical protein